MGLELLWFLEWRVLLSFVSVGHWKGEGKFGGVWL